MAKISTCEPSQVDELRDFSIKTFSETFLVDNLAENVESYIAKAMTKEKLEHELKTDGSFFYFLKDGEETIGYLKLNFAPAQSDLNDSDSLEIERIYVDQEHHGKGFGKMLFDFALDQAVSHKLKYIWLGVWERNYKAIEFYKSNGFVKFAEHPFKLGSDLQKDHLMRRPL